MKILVPLKRVVDPNNANKIQVTPDGARVTSDGLEWKMNPYDEYALEAALRLAENGKTKERLGEIVLVTVSDADSVPILQTGLAMGADRAIRIAADELTLDSSAAATLLKAVVERESPDLVLMGKLNVDSESTAVGPMLAEQLGWPMATFAMRLQTAPAAEILTVGCEVDAGVMTVRLTLPAVVTVSDRMIHPTSVRNGVTPEDFAYPPSDSGRYPSIKGIMASRKKPIEEIAVADLGCEANSLSRYVHFERSAGRSGQATFVTDVDELFDKLRNEARVL